MKDCTIYKTADIIGKRWTLLILLELHKKSRRFNEIKKSLLNITSKILSARLKEMEKNKLITKLIDSSKIPVSCSYSLTPKGKDLMKVIRELKKWGLKWETPNKTCQQTLCRNCVL